jgi:hypothetical protein
MQKGDEYPDFVLPLAHAVASGVGCRYYWCSVVLALQRLGALPLTQPTHEYSLLSLAKIKSAFWDLPCS